MLYIAINILTHFKDTPWIHIRILKNALCFFTICKKNYECIKWTWQTSLHVHTNYRILLVFYILVTIASSIMNKHHTIRWAKLVEQELLTFPEHLSSPLCFSGICVTWSLVLCVCFVDRCLSFCTFSFGHCVVCPTLIYELWIPLWYL